MSFKVIGLGTCHLYSVLMACFQQDYFADPSRKVHRDAEQSYRLEYGRENATHTVLAFSRDLNTCDPNDKEISVCLVMLGVGYILKWN